MPASYWYWSDRLSETLCGQILAYLSSVDGHGVELAWRKAGVYRYPLPRKNIVCGARNSFSYESVLRPGDVDSRPIMLHLVVVSVAATTPDFR